MLESITYRLHELVVVLRCGDVGLGDVRLGRDAAGIVTGQSVSGHAASDNTLAGETRDIRDTGECTAVLADRRQWRQGEHASTT